MKTDDGTTISPWMEKTDIAQTESLWGRSAVCPHLDCVPIGRVRLSLLE